MPIDVKVTPVCSSVGSVMHATVKTDPSSQIIALAHYHDGSAHQHYSWGNADASGMYIWTWTIKPDTPSGEAFVIVEANTGQKGNSAEAGFEVRPVGRCG
jgi:hypothetical protein